AHVVGERGEFGLADRASELDPKRYDDAIGRSSVSGGDAESEVNSWFGRRDRQMSWVGFRAVAAMIA
ncbi:hypothetical protein ACFSQT_38225, partial [Mesorhizobium calcicola]